MLKLRSSFCTIIWSDYRDQTPYLNHNGPFVRTLGVEGSDAVPKRIRTAFYWNLAPLLTAPYYTVHLLFGFSWG